MYVKLIKMCGTSPVTDLDAPVHQLLYQPYIPRRWLHPYNESTLISLLQSKRLFLLEPPLSQLPEYSALFTTSRQGVQFFAHPDVSIAWPLAIINGKTILNEYPLEFIEIFQIAVAKPRIRLEFLSLLLRKVRTLYSSGVVMSISEIAFRSGRKDVIRWALFEHLAPSTRTLEMLDHTISDRRLLERLRLTASNI
jgi:hypothetical protein